MLTNVYFKNYRITKKRVIHLLTNANGIDVHKTHLSNVKHRPQFAAYLNKIIRLILLIRANTADLSSLHHNTLAKVSILAHN